MPAAEVADEADAGDGPIWFREDGRRVACRADVRRPRDVKWLPWPIGVGDTEAMAVVSAAFFSGDTRGSLYLGRTVSPSEVLDSREQLFIEEMRRWKRMVEEIKRYFGRIRKSGVGSQIRQAIAKPTEEEQKKRKAGKRQNKVLCFFHDVQGNSCPSPAAYYYLGMSLDDPFYFDMCRAANQRAILVAASNRVGPPASA